MLPTELRFDLKYQLAKIKIYISYINHFNAKCKNLEDSELNFTCFGVIFSSELELWNESLFFKIPFLSIDSFDIFNELVFLFIEASL